MLDAQGGFRSSAQVDGQAFNPRFMPCGDASCVAVGANIDLNDPETKRWIEAGDAKAKSDALAIGSLAPVPMSWVGKVLGSILGKGALREAIVAGEAAGAAKSTGASSVWENAVSRADGDFGYLNQTPKFGVNPNCLEEMTANGVKYTPENVIATTRSQSGQVVFLEVGNSKAGLQHIIEEHGTQFTQMGVTEAQIPSVVMKAVSEGKLIGYQGSGVGRPIYELTINGQSQRIAVTVGNNGYVVGANPRRGVK
ncbi:hypothetical protein [Pseudomonas frederiksbergensis]|uniref:hypothetical protein n=1 Tax=Pseudomonas frederiksbergensis TaxID=104087 RepID=UPI00191C73FB|nr:hypothetical protein [Pseudomonas frederiksbergensis]